MGFGIGITRYPVTLSAGESWSAKTGMVGIAVFSVLRVKAFAKSPCKNNNRNTGFPDGTTLRCFYFGGVAL